MRVPARTLCAALLVMTCLGTAAAEEGILVVQVSNTFGRPIAGVVLSTTGDSSTGPSTDVAGKTRIRLAPQTRPGHEVELVIVRSEQDLVFISPWNSRVMVPLFENNSQMAARVVLAEKGPPVAARRPAGGAGAGLARQRG